MKKLSLFSFFLILPLYASEPSAFGAGNLENKEPYGLTQEEKSILENKNKVKDLHRNVGGVKVQLDDLLSQYDGLKSVVESINSKIAKIDSEISTMKLKDGSQKESIKKLQNEVESLKGVIEENKKIEESNYQKIEMVLGELSSLIDSINNAYVSKSEYKKGLARLESRLLKKMSAKTSSKNTNLSSEHGATLVKRAKQYYDEKNYDEATVLYEELVRRRYKPARSNYYLGEISYYQKDYANAIDYYKESINLYDKASYAPTLLLHTGISFKKLGDSQNAHRFLKSVISKYPQSKAASIAKKNLSKK